MQELDPRQSAFLAAYINPESPTFGNALQSGLSAGYSQEYSENITNLLPNWLSEKLDEFQMVDQAVRNIRDYLSMQTISDDGKRDTSLEKIKADITKFTAERLDKKRFSTRTELTGRDGAPVGISAEDKAKIDAILNANQKGDS